YYGPVIGSFIWLAAGSGIVLALAYPHKFYRLKLSMYLLLGWAIIVVIGPLSSTIRAMTLALLLMGGVVYSVGAFVHVQRRLRFHNAAWHALVLVAASLRFAAMATELVHDDG